MSLEAFLRTVGASPSPSAPGCSIVEGECLSVAPEGMYFTVKSWDGGKHSFGPAPWPQTAETPTAGARVLVLFLDAGIERPWVLSWWP